MEEPRQPLNIEQAGNYLSEKKESMAEDMHEVVKEAPITFATPEDRIQFLMYGISFLTDISESDKNLFCSITYKSPALYTTKHAVGCIRKLLAARVNGYTYEAISRQIRESIVVIKKVEELGMRIIRGIINSKRQHSIPILGSN